MAFETLHWAVWVVHRNQGPIRGIEIEALDDTTAAEPPNFVDTLVIFPSEPKHFPRLFEVVLVATGLRIRFSPHQLLRSHRANRLKERLPTRAHQVTR